MCALHNHIESGGVLLFIIINNSVTTAHRIENTHLQVRKCNLFFYSAVFIPHSCLCLACCEIYCTTSRGNHRTTTVCFHFHSWQYDQKRCTSGDYEGGVFVLLNDTRGNRNHHPNWAIVK